MAKIPESKFEIHYSRFKIPNLSFEPLAGIDSRFKKPET
jgi:hypothetical protein